VSRAMPDEVGAWAGDVPSAWAHLLICQSTQELLGSRAYPALACLRQPSASQHASHTSPLGDGSAARCLTGNARNNAAEILEALHSVFEDLQLNQLMWQHVPNLVGLLLPLSGAIGADSWMVWPAPLEHVQ
jgi:hypothetical protein